MEHTSLAPPRSFLRIFDNFRFGISADWKIWEILGRDRVLRTQLCNQDAG